MPFLADVYVEAPDATFSTSDWKEYIGNDQPGGGETLSLQSGEATIVNVIDWKKQRSFLRYALGWSYVKSSSARTLSRENPQLHPRFNWLYASTVSFSSIAPAGVSGIGSKVAGAYSDSLPTAAYQKTLATVRFTARRWLFLEDTDSYATEADRNVYLDSVPSVEIISAEGLNNIKFANGPQRGIAIPAPFGTLMSKMTKTYTWLWVPDEYVSGSDPLQYTPTKILNCVGRVNSDTFLGNPPGTLLLQAPVFTPFLFPMQTAGGVYNYQGKDIRLPMQFFDPDRGYDTGNLTIRAGNADGTITIVGAAIPAGVMSGTVDLVFSGGTRTGMTVSSVVGNTIVVTGGAGSNLPAAAAIIQVFDNTFRGHQLVPRRADLKWYACLREDGSSKLYPEAAFAQIFQHVSS